MREILLINISGLDQPGITSTITAILAEQGVNVLDIGQAVIHESLSLGMLIEVPAASETSVIIKEILFRTHEMGLRVKFEPVAEARYQQWVEAQGKPRHIISLLARKVTAEHITRLSTVIAESGLNIDKINRLSGRIPLDHAPQNSKACVEFSARGDIADMAAVRSRFLELASELDVDIAYQDDTIYRRNRRLVCFDMDSTLIEAEVIDELAKAAGVGEKVSEITERAMAGELDFDASFAERLALLEGLDEGVLQDIAAKLPITEGAERLISTLKHLGYKTAILSGGFNYFGKYLQAKLGIDYVYANELDIKDGKVTGRVKGTIVNGERKAELLRELAVRENINLEQVIAVGDGANDLPMLSIAGLGIAFRAKPLVKRRAGHAISTLGLDGILYLIGVSDRDQSHASEKLKQQS
ncbi:MAG TPA: phosphoserine phosphatase SerB [Pseudomonadales bacterium]|nr:phosphoserine phosphatase SerB [Pseudomonadales bacterium]